MINSADNMPCAKVLKADDIGASKQDSLRSVLRHRC